MIKAHVIQVEAGSRVESEKKLGEEFNKWVEANANCKVIKFFEPVRRNEIYGDYNYNKYHTSLTFFYETFKKD